MVNGAALFLLFVILVNLKIKVLGLLGVLLWPLHFGKLVEFYPNLAHVRIMTAGFFGGFIFGFLGTALPRMMSARPFRWFETLPLLGLHAAVVVANAMNKFIWADALMLTLLAGFAICAGSRMATRKDTPPPGFVLVAMSVLCLTAGTVLGVLGHLNDMEPWQVNLQKLLSTQGFVLLPILGIGPFILPRFFGMPSAHDFPEMLRPSREWTRKALLALLAGGMVITSFFAESRGWVRTAHAARFVVVLTYVLKEFPFASAPGAKNALGFTLRVAVVTLLSGFAAVAAFPEFRAALLHLSLMGGFALITFIVASRVVMGHSGQIEKLKERNRWLRWVVGLILFAMLTRISGDFWPKIMISHYNYGAVVWALAAGWWAWKILPNVRWTEPED